MTRLAPSALLVALALPLALLPGCDRDATPPPGEPRRAALADSARARQPSVLFLGDSITQCWNREGAEVWEREFAPLGAMNLGVSGDTTDSLLARLSDYSGTDPEAVVLLIGTNDTKNPALDSGAIAENVLDVIRRIRSTWAGARLLVLGILPREQTPTPKRALVIGANESLVEAAEEGEFDYLDLSDRFVREDGSIPETLMPDAVHLSPAGYRLIAGPIRAWLESAPGGFPR